MGRWFCLHPITTTIVSVDLKHQGKAFLVTAIMQWLSVEAPDPPRRVPLDINLLTILNDISSSDQWVEILLMKSWNTCFCFCMCIV